MKLGISKKKENVMQHSGITSTSSHTCICLHFLPFTLYKHVHVCIQQIADKLLIYCTALITASDKNPTPLLHSHTIHNKLIPIQTEGKIH